MIQQDIPIFRGQYPRLGLIPIAFGIVIAITLMYNFPVFNQVVISNHVHCQPRDSIVLAQRPLAVEETSHWGGGHTRQLKPYLSDITQFVGATVFDQLLDPRRDLLELTAAGTLLKDLDGFRPATQVPLTDAANRRVQFLL